MAPCELTAKCRFGSATKTCSNLFWNDDDDDDDDDDDEGDNDATFNAKFARP